MATQSKLLGILKPVGGGDPIPLSRDSMTIGRRPSCDIRLDFEMVSGKHCELRFFNGLWHIRDIGSTNGTTVNGMKIAIEHSVLPDVEIGIGGRPYTIEYEPAGPSSVTEAANLLDDDVIETRTRKSLMELAGLATDEPRKSYRSARPPEEIERISVDEGGFEESIPSNLPPAMPLVEASDDDFFNLIQDDLTPKKK